MKRIYKYFSFLLLVFSVTAISCDDFLDMAPKGNLDENLVFSDFANAQRYHNDIYDNLRARFNVVGDYEPVPLASASDEADSYAGHHGATNFNIGNYDGLDAGLGNYYSGIRKANKFISKKEIIPFPSEGKKNQMLGEAYFLRAFYFNEVVKRFGGMPIVDENNMIEDPDEGLFLPRNTYKECINSILTDLNTAAGLLPATLSENEYGRATKGAALALKARILLFGASPLWQREMQENLWQQAAEAAKAVIDLKDNGDLVYELYNTGNGADDYEKLFFTRRESGNKEIIFYKHASPINFSASEISVWAPKGGALGGSGAVAPTQNFVNLFEMNDGKLIGDPASSYDSQNPYQNRDPRFYKIVLYNEVQWQGETMDLTYNENKDLSGRHRQDKTTHTRTGYYVRKYLPEEVKDKTSNTAYHNWIFIRLAEMHLNYAEAINEAADSEANRQLAYAAVNQVRNRSGVVNLPSGLNQQQLRERIWNERAIELSFEEHRWWDARRWGKAKDWFGGPMYEMEIRKDGNNFIYNELPFHTRIYLPYMDLYPIPINEMRKNPLFTQNPEW